MLNVPPKVQPVVQSMLQPDERVLWSGWPRPLRLARDEWLMGAFGGVWIGLTWLAWAALDEKAGALNYVLPLISLVGLLPLSMPLSSAMRASEIGYVVTNRRVFRVQLGHGWPAKPNVRQFTRELIEKADTLVNADGSGDLIFDVTIRPPRRNGQLEQLTLVGFLGIEDVEGVHALARKTAQAMPKD